MNTLIEKTSSKTKIFYDDVYLVDASRNCEVISSRRGAVGLSRGDCFLGLIDTKTKVKLFEWLSSFVISPLTIETELGEATVYNGIFPSTMLFIVQFKHNSEVRDIPCLDVGILSSRDTDEDTLCTQALLISELCGCPVHIDTDAFDNSAMADALLSEFDFPLYTAFLINSLLLARRTAKEREAQIIIKTKEESHYVSVVFESSNDFYDVYGELSSMSNIADRLRLIFTRSFRNGKLEVTLNPARRNWALLGIKTPFIFTWDDEET